MDNNFSANYIKANAPTIAENCVKFLLWENRPFSATIAHCADYVREYGYCDPAKMAAAVYAILRSMSTVDGLRRFITSRRAIYVRPAYTSTAAFIKENLETNLSINALSALIAGEVSIAA